MGHIRQEAIVSHTRFSVREIRIALGEPDGRVTQTPTADGYGHPLCRWSGSTKHPLNVQRRTTISDG